MKEIIEAIIELLLEDVTCDHELAKEEGTTFYHVAYSLRNEKDTIKRMVKILEKVKLKGD